MAIEQQPVQDSGTQGTGTQQGNEAKSEVEAFMSQTSFSRTPFSQTTLGIEMDHIIKSASVLGEVREKIIASIFSGKLTTYVSEKLNSKVESFSKEIEELLEGKIWDENVITKTPEEAKAEGEIRKIFDAYSIKEDVKKILGE